MDEQRYSLAAASGALISALRGTGSWQRRGILFFSGYGFAVWVGPVLVEHLQLTTQEQMLGLGFCCGFLGDMCLTLGSYWVERLVRYHLITLMKEKK